MKLGTFVVFCVRRFLQLEYLSWKLLLRISSLPITAIFYRKERFLLWRLWEHTYGTKRLGPFPENRLSDIIPECGNVVLSDIFGETYNVTEIELLYLACICKALSPTFIFEFGTANGRTTLTLAKNSIESCKVYTLNVKLENDSTHSQSVPVGDKFLNTSERSKIIQLWGDSMQFDFHPLVGKFQLIFIDANHSESAVKTDSDSALRLVDPDKGAIIWHDALDYGVPNVLRRFIRDSHLPIRIISGTSLAILCFYRGNPVDGFIKFDHVKSEL